MREVARCGWGRCAFLLCLSSLYVVPPWSSQPGRSSHGGGAGGGGPSTLDGDVSMGSFESADQGGGDRLKVSTSVGVFGCVHFLKTALLRESFDEVECIGALTHTHTLRVAIKCVCTFVHISVLYSKVDGMKECTY